MSIQERLDTPAEGERVLRFAAPPAAPRSVVSADAPVADAAASDAPGTALVAAPGGPGGPPSDPTAFRPGPPSWGGPAPVGVPQDRSSYMEYLPGIYSGNEFLARFLLIFEHQLAPIARTIDNIPHLFDPYLTPRSLIEWLGGWLGLVMDERWPEARRRELIRSASRLYRLRGTRRGLAEFIRLYTGYEAEIVEPTVSDVATRRDLAFRFTVRIRVGRDEDVDIGFLRRIVDLEKPAFAAGTIELVRE
ncbi:MAG: phage tail protein [Hyphomicrobiales bacterium]